MKKIFLSLIASSVTLISFAQLKVENSGIVTLGFPLNHTAYSNREANVQVLGPYGTYNAGGRLAFGDMGIVSTSSINVFAGEYGTTDTDKLQLHGKLGLYFTTGGIGSYVAMKIENDHVYATNNIYATNFVNISDKRFKTNIQDIRDISGLFKLRAVSYQYNFPESMRPKATSFGVDVKGNNTLGTAKSPEDKIGFLAQEVREIYPQLVHEDGNGTLSVDYVSLIPLLVEAVKTQQAQIDQLAQKVNQTEVTTSARTASYPIIQNNTEESASLVILQQNAPNPFTESTQINFSINPAVVKASLHIYSLQGEELKQYPLTARGNGYIEIKANEFNPGLYYYAIVYDQKLSGTKTMVITK